MAKMQRYPNKRLACPSGRWSSLSSQKHSSCTKAKSVDPEYYQRGPEGKGPVEDEDIRGRSVQPEITRSRVCVFLGFSKQAVVVG